jgi:hypothetical protein
LAKLPHRASERSMARDKKLPSNWNDSKATP